VPEQPKRLRLLTKPKEITMTMIMANRVLAVCTLLLTALATKASAQNNTVTQVGPWTCAMITYPTYRCDDVEFAPPYGMPPNVAIGFNNFQSLTASNGSNPITIPRLPRNFRVAASNVTAKGFTPILTHDGRREDAYSIYGGGWVAVGPSLVNATVVPKYLVLTVIYAPPGMNGPKGTGSITYQENSTVGTTTSASKSFKQAYSVSALAEGGYIFASGSNELRLEWSRAVTDKQSLDIKISQTGGLRGQGSDKEDGVNNDDDAIYLALSPTINVQMAPSLVQWTFANPKEFIVTHVYVAWLENPDLFQTEAPAVKKLLEDNGIIEQDYPDILKRDPLATGAIDPPVDRYELRTSFDYVPPHPCDIAPLTTTLVFQRQSTSSTEHIVQDEYQVGLTHKDKVQFGSSDDGLGVAMTLSGGWTWTNQSSSGSSTSTTETATLAAGGPKCGFDRATSIDVYFDKIYRTFAFRERKGTPTLHGSIASAAVVGTMSIASGQSLSVTEVRRTEVQLVDANGREQKTFTNANGEWNFMRPVTFPVTITANGITGIVGESGAVTK
jgi:hypothetical protein